MFNCFENYLNRLLEVITPETGKLFSSKNALIWFMLFDKFTKKGLPDNKFQLFLEYYDEFKRIKVKVPHEYMLIKGSGEYTDTLSFAELDGCKSTKDKGVIEDKLHILETVMNNFLHNESEDSIETSDNDKINAIDIINECTDASVDSEDVELYEMMANDFSENIDDINSEFLSERNRPSFVALVGYADLIGKSQLLNEWLPVFEKEKKIIVDQKKNFLHMKNDFEQYLKKCA